MSDFAIQSVSTAQWHALVSRAEAATGCVLGETVESYVVGLLMRFSGNPQKLTRLLSLDYLNDDYLRSKSRSDRLRDIGDHCLLFAGLFPDYAERHTVRLSYFVGLGQSAYEQLGEADSDDKAPLYACLSKEFVQLMDLLQAMHELRDDRAQLTPLDAFDLWSDTGSRQAYRVIRSVTDAFPVSSGPIEDPLLM